MVNFIDLFSPWVRSGGGGGGGGEGDVAGGLGGESGGGRVRVQGRRRFVSKQLNAVCQAQYNDVGETFERRGGAHMGVSERIDTILN